MVFYKEGEKMIKYIYELRLVNNNGQVIKKLFILPEEIIRLEPADDYKTNCLFLTRWAEDRKKELFRLLGKKSGTLNICAISTFDGCTKFGTDYITL